MQGDAIQAPQLLRGCLAFWPAPQGFGQPYTPATLLTVLCQYRPDSEHSQDDDGPVITLIFGRAGGHGDCSLPTLVGLPNVFWSF